MQDVELAPTSHMWAIHRYLRYGAWVGAERRQLLASSADESLFVSIGGALGHGVFGPGRTDIRAAVISGKFDTPHPLLPSARGAEAFDDSGDEEYLDDAEASDDEDWDSDEEEEIEEQQQKEEKEDDDDEVGGRRSRAIGTEPSWDSQKEMVLSQVEISGTKWI
ncbi:hypothetical protein F4778DRAFT_693429 [Xylariomycetidae sp. FL2044]|nr:hypothetical protein F4778DRAFT_693429 [Xylariomycetidae sp. FL2044]